MEYLGIVWFIGHGPIAAALIIALFWAALSRPDRVRSYPELRLAALCLGVSILASVIIPVAVVAPLASADARGERREHLAMAAYLYPIPAVLTMFALLLGLDSVTPRPARPAAAPRTDAAEPR